MTALDSVPFSFCAQQRSPQNSSRRYESCLCSDWKVGSHEKKANLELDLKPDVSWFSPGCNFVCDVTRCPRTLVISPLAEPVSRRAEVGGTGCWSGRGHVNIGDFCDVITSFVTIVTKLCFYGDVSMWADLSSQFGYGPLSASNAPRIVTPS